MYFINIVINTSCLIIIGIFAMTIIIIASLGIEKIVEKMDNNAINKILLLFQNLENWRRERDSNPRYETVYTLSRRAPSTARTSLL